MVGRVIAETRGGAGGKRTQYRTRIITARRSGITSDGWDDPGVAQVMEAYRKRTGRDPERHFAIGDEGMMVARIAEYVEAGASKFILRPAARGDEGMLDQTRRLIEQVLPMVAARWPKGAKAA